MELNEHTEVVLGLTNIAFKHSAEMLRWEEDKLNFLTNWGLSKVKVESFVI